MSGTDAGILRLLRATEGHLSRADLTSQLQISPEALAGRLAGLQEAGYDIEEHPHLGCRLVSAPDRLIADDLVGMLEGVALAKRILVFAKTDSTNDVALRMARDGAPEGLVIFAEEQTAGRGRLGRRWESDSHLGLWFSLVVRPAFTPAHWTRLTTWAAVAIAEAIEAEIGCKTAIKWPNDVYIEGKKAVGVLIESHFGKSGEGFAIVGIGINVNQTVFPPELSEKAVSLRMAAGISFDRQQIAAAILRNLDARYRILETDFPRILAIAEERSFLRGKSVQITYGGQVVHGTVAGLDPEGALVLQTPEGAEVVISSGEATINR